jgi:hypothetical protein
MHEVENQPRLYYDARSTNQQDRHILVLYKIHSSDLRHFPPSGPATTRL